MTKTHITSDFMKVSFIQKNDFFTLKSCQVESPLGPLFVVSDEESLYFIGFIDAKGMKEKIKRLCLKTKLEIIPGNTGPITSIKEELSSYFKGTLKEFKTPLYFLGTPFQQLAWDVLKKIPYGKTKSYKDQAQAIGNPSAYRAVANANGANHFPIVIPCHRIISHDGSIGGYGGGCIRKKWLIEHEQRHSIFQLNESRKI